MSTTIFKIVDSCLNCQYRQSRIDRNILCTKHRRKSDNNVAWMSDRGWCSDYVKTENKSILRSEEQLLKGMQNYAL